ncbi:DNA topoisomerase I, mitochondrial [Centruroides vittatus]|uniref:DNA topoisomerase I, mitochondrial n=1 Tax=Centruroides vittatus TaxID=120091 RepID=UPI00350F3294
MNSFVEQFYSQIEGSPQPVHTSTAPQHGSNTKPMMSPTHNGYKNISNHSSHKSKQEVANHSKPGKEGKILESSKHHHNIHNSSSNKHSDSSKHKEHKMHSSSKLKDSSGLKESSKSHSSKSETLKLKDHQNHEKSSFKTKDSSSKSTNDISKKLSSKPKEHKDGDKIKKEGEKHKNSETPKEKLKDGIHKEKHKDSSSKDKLKESSDKPKDSHNSEKKIKIKKENSENKGPVLVKLKQEKKESENHIKIKMEPSSDDDVPLAERKTQKEIASFKLKRSSEDSDDEPLAKRAEKVKHIKSEKSESKKRKYDGDDLKSAKKIKKEKDSKKTKTANETPSTPKKRGKQEEEAEVWKWWEEEKYDSGIKWKTLQHNGPVFAPPYEPIPKNVKFYYNGNPLELSSEAEEVAGFYARMLDHDYTTKDAFNKNFFKDWRKVMTPQERELITDLKKCNFSELNEYYKQKSEERKNMTKEEKNEIKKQNEELQKTYGFCIIDGHKQKIGNFKIEPPGLFRGRGEHPKMGMLKRRVRPEDIIINIGKEATVPPPPEGHKWKEIRHDNSVTWLACWSENILGQTKYIMLNPSSKLKGEKDWQKYETARKLKSLADGIRRQYMEDWKSKEMKVRQRAVALYFIDKLALRAGNEKEEGETADTVGCCSLRVEHITLNEEKDGKQYVVDFDFLGKDSIRYVNSVAVEKRVFKNLKLFMENKQPGDDLFDRLNTAILNKHLNELMDGLTAKVFRTYNASKTLQEQLDLLTKAEMSLPEKLLAYNRANRAVAILCNHQRSVPKTFSKQMENLQKKIEEKEEQIREFKKELKKAKQAYKDSNTSKDKVIYEKKKKRFHQLEEQLNKLEVQATDKEENKQIALGTSKLNYLDPRISVAWCKKWNVPVEKIYNRTQRDKFRWAIEMAGPDFIF